MAGGWGGSSSKFFWNYVGIIYNIGWCVFGFVNVCCLGRIVAIVLGFECMFGVFRVVCGFNVKEFGVCVSGLWIGFVSYHISCFMYMRK